MEDVLERPRVAKVAKLKVTKSQEQEEEKSQSAAYGEVHPYMTPEFWLNEKNHFWKRNSLYKQDAYGGFLERCRAELKENLIN